jgi:hypothetical protein
MTMIKQADCSHDRPHGNWYEEKGRGFSFTFSCGSASIGAGVSAAEWLRSELARGDSEGGRLREGGMDLLIIDTNNKTRVAIHTPRMNVKKGLGLPMLNTASCTSVLHGMQPPPKLTNTS